MEKITLNDILNDVKRKLYGDNYNQDQRTGNGNNQPQEEQPKDGKEKQPKDGKEKQPKDGKEKQPEEKK